MSIIPEAIAPEIRPKVSTIFFMVRALGTWTLRVTAAVWQFRRHSRVAQTDDSCAGTWEITLSGDEPRLFRALDRLRPPPRRELAEQPGGMRLHGVLPHEQPFADLPSA